MKKFFKEFKEFIARGNIVDLSVAVIIGAAFSAIVTSLTNQIIMPLVNWIISLCVGKNGLTGAITVLSPVYTTDELGNKVLDLTASIYINWGAFISAIINFLIIAFTVFCIVKVINTSKKKLSEINNKVKKEIKKEFRQEKQLVKEQALKDNVKFKIAWKKYLEEKEAQQKAKEEAEQKAKEEAEKNKPTVESLLFDIKELLKNQNNSTK